MNSHKKKLLATLKHTRIDQLGRMGEWFFCRRRFLFLEEWLGIIRRVNISRKILCPLLCYRTVAEMVKDMVEHKKNRKEKRITFNLK